MQRDQKVKIAHGQPQPRHRQNIPSREEVERDGSDPRADHLHDLSCCDFDLYSTKLNTRRGMTLSGL